MRTIQLSLSLAGATLFALAALAPAYAASIKNVVIVHGALADGFWRSLYSRAARSGLDIPLSLPA